ncbi:MAG: DUF4124 domain-containing protein [Acinetobacter sp.]|jgi:hypothetical protein|nr:MAG: DUF4124 domain-containing protein [Acinetobacter sp.]
MAVDFYKWTDEQGSTHYSTTPPVQQSTKKQKVSTRLSRFDKILVEDEHQPNGGRFDDTQLVEPPLPPVPMGQNPTPDQATDTKLNISQVPVPTLAPTTSIEPKNPESTAQQTAQKSSPTAAPTTSIEAKNYESLTNQTTQKTSPTQNSQVKVTNPATETANAAPTREEGTHRAISNPNKTTVLAYCDNKGCWGTDGIFYTRTTDDNFLDPNKNKCMITNKKMSCF